MDNKFIGLMVGLTVGVLMVSGFLWPIVSDATASETTFKNEGYFNMARLDEGTELNVVWDYTNPTTLTVNSNAVSLPDKDSMSSIPFTIMCCNNWYLRYGWDTASGYYLGLYQNSSNTSYSGNVNESRSFTVNVSTDGTTTVNNGVDHTWSAATGNFYIISEEGPFVMKKQNADAYVNGDSQIFGYGRTNARGYNYTSELTGSVNNGITGQYYPETTISGTGWTFSDVTLNSEEVTGYEDLYKISTMTYEITGENIQPYTAVFSQYIVPAEVTSEKSWHLDTTQVALVAAIGTLGAIVLIAAAAGSIRRLD